MNSNEKCKNCAGENRQMCGGCAGRDCSDGGQVCGGCECPGQNQTVGCSRCQGATKGCGGGCPHAVGNEFEWDYDDTVLVFSSDMLEESP